MFFKGAVHQILQSSIHHKFLVKTKLFSLFLIKFRTV